jgi:hypothetical protein
MKTFATAIVMSIVASVVASSTMSGKNRASVSPYSSGLLLSLASYSLNPGLLNLGSRAAHVLWPVEVAA